MHLRRLSYALAIATAVACLTAPNPAVASTSTDSFSVTGTGVSASGTLTLTTTGTPGVDEITGITGTFSTTAGGGFSGTITGLEPASYSSSSPSTSPGGLSIYDNLFYPGSATATCDGVTTSELLDYCGLDFIVAGAYQVNVFGTGGDTYEVSDALLSGSGGYIDNDNPVTFTATPTPEPSSFALLGTGLLGVAEKVRRSFTRRA